MIVLKTIFFYLFLLLSLLCLAGCAASALRIWRKCERDERPIALIFLPALSVLATLMPFLLASATGHGLDLGFFASLIYRAVRYYLCLVVPILTLVFAIWTLLRNRKYVLTSVILIIASTVYLVFVYPLWPFT